MATPSSNTARISYSASPKDVLPLGYVATKTVIAQGNVVDTHDGYLRVEAYLDPAKVTIIKKTDVVDMHGPLRDVQGSWWNLLSAWFRGYPET
ncbi:MAG: hypothetical protein ACHQ7N_21680 [Candidatus Methylomirabilales bacterium]